MEVDGISVAKAQEIENASVVSGAIAPGTGHLILSTRGGTDIDAGLVAPDGPITGTIAEYNSALTDGDFTTLAGFETLTNKDLTDPSNELNIQIVKMVASGFDGIGLNTITAETLFLYTDTTITLEQDTMYRVSVITDAKSDTAGGLTTFRLKHGLTVTSSAGNLIGTFAKDHRVANRVEGVSFFNVVAHTDPDVAGTYFKLTVQGSGGGVSAVGTVSPTYLIVERIGSAA